MSRFFLLIGIMSVLLGGAATVAHAQETPMTEEHIARIKANCVEAKSTMNRLHASDALLRVNRGQLFESISTKLMAPFNSRVAINQLDSGKLVSITSVYGKELDGFRTDYQQYEEAMSHVLQLDCTKQPVAFYDGVADARKKRDAVHARAEALQKATRDYKEAFEAFAATFKEEQ
jgi:hypothetical protein